MLDKLQFSNDSFQEQQFKNTTFQEQQFSNDTYQEQEWNFLRINISGNSDLNSAFLNCGSSIS